MNKLKSKSDLFRRGDKVISIEKFAPIDEKPFKVKRDHLLYFGKETYRKSES